MKSRSVIDIGSLIEYKDPLTNQSYEGTVIRIEPWHSPERIHLSSAKSDQCERYLVFWQNGSPQDQDRSWVCDQNYINLTPTAL